MNECGSGAECSEEKHQENRRTTAKILKEGESVAVHKVQDGETLGSIAIKYDVRVFDLKAWNGMNNTNLRIGTTITNLPLRVKTLKFYLRHYVRINEDRTFR